VVKALTGLPGAAGVSAGCLANLVRICAARRSSSKLGPVLQLPCAQRLSSEQLCDLVKIAGKAQLWSLVQELCRWVVGGTLCWPSQEQLGTAALLVCVLRQYEIWR
jgi:hypothetical protein